MRANNKVLCTSCQQVRSHPYKHALTTPVAQFDSPVLSLIAALCTNWARLPCSPTVSCSHNMSVLHPTLSSTSTFSTFTWTIQLCLPVTRSHNPPLNLAAHSLNSARCYKYATKPTNHRPEEGYFWLALFCLIWSQNQSEKRVDLVFLELKLGSNTYAMKFSIVCLIVLIISLCILRHEWRSGTVSNPQLMLARCWTMWCKQPGQDGTPTATCS